MNIFELKKGDPMEAGFVHRMTEDEAAVLPAFVKESLEMGVLAASMGNLYGNSIVHILGD